MQVNRKVTNLPRGKYAECDVCLSISASSITTSLENPALFFQELVTWTQHTQSRKIIANKTQQKLHKYYLVPLLLLE